MALYYIFSNSLRSTYPIFSSLLCRNRCPVQGLAVAASHFRLQNQWFSTKTLTNVSDDSTVFYLVHSCGLSPEAAIEASHKVKLQSLEKPNSVLALLREYEFSDTQISTLVRRYPHILVADAKKTLLPKLQFLCSKGVSRVDVAETVSNNSVLLKRSLEKCIMPCYTFLKRVVMSDVKVLFILKYRSCVNLSRNVIPNIRLVTELGMPHSSIAYLLTYYTGVLARKPDIFSQTVRRVEEMGFDPGKMYFVQAMVALTAKKTTWRLREEAYRSWGWSDDDILSAFKMCPLCMNKSRKKIMGTMDFFVNKMGWKSGQFAKYPGVFLYSLEKRIIPRGSVVKVLLLKGLIEENKLSLSSVFSTREEIFLNRFVTRYLDQVPQLSDVYRGKIDVQDV